MVKLYRLLVKGTKDYEDFSLKADSLETQDVLRKLALTSHQFASALYNKLQSLSALPVIESEVSVPAADQKISAFENVGFDFLAEAEKAIITAYREVLHEPFIDSGLRQMIHFQLSETLYLFMHLKLMNLSRLKIH